MRPRDCLAVLRKVFVDWTNVCNVSVWDGSLVEVHSLTVWAKI
jgi:hypothetical protein